MTTAEARSFERHIRQMMAVAVPAEERPQVATLLRAIEGMHLPKRRAPKCRLVGPGGKTTPIPDPVFLVLERIVEVFARGDAIAVVPVGTVVTTQQAADILNVSRQYVVRLLDEGRIPFSRTGKHRRLRIEDVLAYKRQRDENRGAGLRELSRLTQEFDGYDAEPK